jgi:hypothetical protein
MEITLQIPDELARLLGGRGGIERRARRKPVGYTAAADHEIPESWWDNFLY